MHACADEMQLPTHSFVPLGQVPLHVAPSHVAVPPAGVAHAEHDDPHEATSVFDRHCDPHG
jgi:hypothetical protein